MPDIQKNMGHVSKNTWERLGKDAAAAENQEKKAETEQLVR